VDDRLYGYRDEELRLRMMVAAQYDAPAYVRRARAVESEFETLLARCRKKRSEWLFGVRLFLGELRSEAGDWSALRPLLADDDQVDALAVLHAEAGDPEHTMTGPKHDAGRRRALLRLRGSVERFNRRWLSFVEEVDLSPLNRLRDGYNRWYLLEKECAVGPGRLLAQTFCQLPRFTTGDLLDRLPTLPIPRPAG
jgi:hypothetical protein